jgi:hypothetical protein
MNLLPAFSRRAALPGLLALALGLSLSACQAARDSLGLTKRPPDEFNVVTRAPLEMPPSLDVLPQPQPGMQRPQELRPQETAMLVLLGGQPDMTLQASGAEASLLAMAEADAADPDIRDTVDIEHQKFLTERGFMEELQFWRDHPDVTEVVIDPVAEKQRLQNNAALGLPANAGEFEGVIVEPKEKALLEGIF